ncbi:MAG: glycosyltransferase, partial [Acidimicrobiia bacterium]
MATPPVLPPVPLHAPDFDAADLVRRKRDAGLRISVCLPARDEEATVGHIVATVRRTLMETVPLVDEVVVLDDGSIDATAEVAAWEGARVVPVADVLPAERRGQGKGNAMWSSLYESDGDL